MKFTQSATWVTAAVLLLAGAGCSSSNSSDAGGSTTTTAAGDKGSDSPETSGKDSLQPVSVCPLLDAADLATVGVSGAGKPTERTGPPGVALGACTWGSIDAGMLVVQVESRGDGLIVDPLETLLGAAKSEPKPASQPDGAKIYDVALLPSGGGTGTSVAVESGTQLVVVSRFGDNVDVPALEALTSKVVGSL